MDISFSNDSEDLTRHNESDDLIVGMKAVRVWGTLGWHDIRQRYRRSVLGPFWFTLSTIIMVVVLGALYSTLLDRKSTRLNSSHQVQSRMPSSA